MMASWRRFVSHLWPAIIGLCIFAFIFAISDQHFERRDFRNPRVEPNVVQPGQIAEFKFEAIGEVPYLQRLCAGIVHRWIIDARGFVFTLVDTDAAEIIPVDHGSFSFIRPFPVPAAAADGTATYHSQVTRWCNPLQEIFWPVVDYHSASFEVKR